MGSKRNVRRGDMTEAERKSAQRREKARRADREMGKPRRVYDHEFRAMVAKVHAMHDAGMTQAAMSNATGGVLTDKQFSDILCGRRGHSYRTTYNAIMAAEIIEGDGEFGGRTPVIGSVRRLQALRANGWPIKSPILEELSGVPVQALRTISMNGRAYVFYSTHLRIKKLYEKLQDADPADYGIPELSVRKSKTYANKYNMAPAICWDDDTIDNPDAFPEWTGECGTVTGYNLHRKHGIHVRVSVDRHGNERMNVLCDACCVARMRQKSDIEAKREANRAEALRMLAAGKSHRAIAAELGMSTRTVQRYQRDHDNEG